MEKRSKAFFINGGAGRMLCSVPAFEKYEQESGDKDFIIVCEGGTDVFKGHPTLDSRTYDVWHKNLFVEKLKDKDIYTIEPYRVWEYYNQKCSIAQAIDIEINKQGVRELPKPTLRLSKDELIAGRQLISEVKKKLKKEKIIVFQPFGRGIEYLDESFVDRTSRSIEYKDVKKIIQKLQEKGFAVIMMSEIKLDLTQEKNIKDEIAFPENISIRQWAAVIKYADHFLGCDSLGQHLAYSMDKPSTVVFGSTYPINVSYPNAKNFNILDMGEELREYSPIRITMDERIDRKHESLMTMTPEIIDYVVDAVIGKHKK
jgi:ADP-heptose:LPS heptosyltransferase